MGFHGKLTDFLDLPLPRVQWIIEGYLPLGGIVFMHGKTSIGKSPLLWKLMQCVSEGVEFFGHPTLKGNVIYIELDTPDALIQSRLSLLEPVPKNVYLYNAYPGLNVLELPQTHKAAFERLAQLDPVMVCVNTLRRCHAGDDKDSSIPSRVYGAWGRLFPSSTIVFSHHNHKSQTDSYGAEIEGGDQAFSGSQHWQDDAQVALHLIPVGKRTLKKVRLEMTKSQVGAIPDHLHLQLLSDGTNWIEVGDDAIKAAFDALAPLPKMERYALVAAQLGMGDSTVRAAIAKIAKGLSNHLTLVPPVS